MKKIFNIALVSILLISCSQKQEKTNPNLIYFDSHFLAELGEENHDKYAKEVDSKINPKYLERIIYISKIIEANACGNYIGNFEIKKDSLILIYKLNSEEVCTSTAINQVTYIIKNPKENKYKFGLRYE
jgi:hypothetical protein